jgi:hypothetical protein
LLPPPAPPPPLNACGTCSTHQRQASDLFAMVNPIACLIDRTLGFMPRPFYASPVAAVAPDGHFDCH